MPGTRSAPMRNIWTTLLILTSAAALSAGAGTGPIRSGPALGPTCASSITELPSTAALRASGPDGLRLLLERYDRNPDARLLADIDAVAAQRDAVWSRLYWYTDLEQAKTAAKAQKKPILYLRMLGKLTDEYSCANSRFFRTVLYANAKVSQLLRDHFVL